jgi:hypothetical protein
MVTLQGANLGSGTDIDSVTLCGYPATVVSQDAASVVVEAPNGPAPGPCTAVVQSVSVGNTNGLLVFTYNPCAPHTRLVWWLEEGGLTLLVVQRA